MIKLTYSEVVAADPPHQSSKSLSVDAVKYRAIAHLARVTGMRKLSQKTRPHHYYRVARQPCGRPALSELGVKVSLHPAQALRTPL